MKSVTKKYQGSFTLIEILVSIAIIGILAAVVLPSLNTARKKGAEAAIKSNLKNMIAQAELSYYDTNNYSGACASISPMLAAIDRIGGSAFCYTMDNLRWGVTAKLDSDATKNWAADQNGVVSWDTSDAGGSDLNWAAANTACSGSGAHLPSIEQMKALYEANGGTPPSFRADWYWSGTTDPSTSANAYDINMADGDIDSCSKTLFNDYVRCVR